MDFFSIFIYLSNLFFWEEEGEAKLFTELFSAVTSFSEYTVTEVMDLRMRNVTDVTLIFGN